MSRSKSELQGTYKVKTVSKDRHKYNIKLDQARSVAVTIVHHYARIPGFRYNNGVAYRGTTCEMAFRSDRILKTVNSDPKKKAVIKVFQGETWLHPEDILAWQRLYGVRRIRNVNWAVEGMRRSVQLTLDNALIGLDLLTMRPNKASFKEEVLYTTQVQIWNDYNFRALQLWKLDKAMIWAELLPGKHNYIVKEVTKRIETLFLANTKVTNVDQRVIDLALQYLRVRTDAPQTVHDILRHCESSGWKCMTGNPHEYIMDVLNRNKRLFKAHLDKNTLLPRYSIQSPPKLPRQLHERRTQAVIASH